MLSEINFHFNFFLIVATEKLQLKSDFILLLLQKQATTALPQNKLL